MAGRAARYAVEELYKLSQPTLKRLFNRGKRPVTRDPDDLGSRYTEVEVDPLKWQELMVERNYPHSVSYNLENTVPPRGLPSGSLADYSLRKLRNFGKWLGDNPKEAVRTPTLDLNSRGFPDQPGGRHRAFTSAIIEEPSMTASIPTRQLQRFRDSDLLTTDVPYDIRSYNLPSEGLPVEFFDDLPLPPMPNDMHSRAWDQWNFLRDIQTYAGLGGINEGTRMLAGIDDYGYMAGGAIIEPPAYSDKYDWLDLLGSMRPGGGTQLIKRILDDDSFGRVDFTPTLEAMPFYSKLGGRSGPQGWTISKPMLRGMAPLGALPLLENEE